MGIRNYFETCIFFNATLNTLPATNLNWLHVLKNDYHKQILPEALKDDVDKNEVTHRHFRE